MCGIAGIISRNTNTVSISTLCAMAASIAHRGPDGQAHWVNETGHTGFSHRRLAIVDLSNAAAQPMHYAGRYTIVYNGEIYNYIEIREALIARGFCFYSESDTEVILAAYAAYGTSCLEHFDGMFSFAIWDAQEEILFCARDRFGEKPFYYALSENGDTLYFGSEIKALREAGVTLTVRHSLLLQFMAHGYTADPGNPATTFYNEVKKLPPAHYAIYSLRETKFTITRYWELRKEYRSHVSAVAAPNKLIELLVNSIKVRLRSDVSIGSSLSGGLDSSSIAALVNDIGGNDQFRTFTAVFPGFRKDESSQAKLIADNFGFDNFTVAPSAGGLADDLRRVMHHQEEPFNSASVYAQYKVFELARSNGTTVLLDGQGADECLAGYDKYVNWHLRAIFPNVTRKLLQTRERRKLQHNVEIDPQYLHQWSASEPSPKPTVRSLNDLLHFDVCQNGLEELLRYADRNSMAHGREVRLPYLNHDVVNFVFSLSDNQKICNGWSKWILRTAIGNRIPHEIAWKRFKTAFEPPQKEWMMHPKMKALIYESKEALVKKNILNKAVLEKRKSAHDAYTGDDHSWRYLMAHLFLEGVK